MNLSLTSPRVKKIRTKSMKKKNNGESSGDESDLCKNCKKSKLRALGKRNSNKSNNEKVEKAAPTIRK